MNFVFIFSSSFKWFCFCHTQLRDPFAFVDFVVVESFAFSLEFFYRLLLLYLQIRIHLNQKHGDDMANETNY